MSIIFVVIVAIDKINWHLCISTYKYGTVKKKKKQTNEIREWNKFNIPRSLRNATTVFHAG